MTWRSADDPCGELYNVLLMSVLVCIAAVRWKGLVEVDDGGRGGREGDDEAKATCSRELTDAGGEGCLRVFPWVMFWLVVGVGVRRRGSGGASLALALDVESTDDEPYPRVWPRPYGSLAPGLGLRFGFVFVPAFKLPGFRLLLVLLRF